LLSSVCCTGGIDEADWFLQAKCRTRSEIWTPSISRCQTAGDSELGYPVNCAGKFSSTSGAGQRVRCIGSGRTWASDSGLDGCSKDIVPRVRRRARYPQACTAEPPEISTRRYCDGTVGALVVLQLYCSSTTACRAERRRGRWSTR